MTCRKEKCKDSEQFAETENMESNYTTHTLYEDKEIRAIFRPLDTEGLNAGTRQMAGHEFVWRHAGYAGTMPLWVPADTKDIDNYFEVIDCERPAWAYLWILEEDLDIMRVEKLDG